MAGAWLKCISCASDEGVVVSFEVVRFRQRNEELVVINAACSTILMRVWYDCLALSAAIDQCSDALRMSGQSW